MIENKFNEGTLGHAACKMLAEIVLDDSTRKTILILEKDEAVKKILAAQEAKGANIKLGIPENSAMMKSLDVEAAINALISGNTSQITNPLAGQPIIDIIRVHFANKDYIDIPVAICKAISANTALIQQGTLASTRIISQSANNQTNNKAGIKDTLVRSNIPVFEHRTTSENENIVIKNRDVSDISTGCHLDFGDLNDYDALNILINFARYVSEIATIATYIQYGKEHPNDTEMYKTALRLQNRKLEDSIFDEVWLTHFEEPNLNDIEGFKRYINMMKRFHATLSKIGQGSNVSPYTHRFGLERVDVVTSQTQNVSSTKRISRVKKNKVNSYITIKPQDTGICTAVFSDEASRSEFIASSVTPWMKVAAKWLYNESRHVIGLSCEKIPDEELAPLVIQQHEPVSAAEALQITDNIDGLQEEFLMRCYELSEKVITDERMAMDREIVQTLHTLFK